ncbi:MAG TPA: ribonuclease P protein component [Candidatus Paceibacterota bacterium]|nr:ribonuclease P protein component [Candidatus Paceibacterota bacterium]
MEVSRLSREGATATLKRGVSIHSPLFSLKFLKNPLNKAYLAISVSKKEEKTAVGRNRIKRRLKAAFKKALEQGEITGNFMVIAKKASKISPFLALSEEVERAVEKLFKL